MPPPPATATPPVLHPAASPAPAPPNGESQPAPNGASPAVLSRSPAPSPSPLPKARKWGAAGKLTVALFGLVVLCGLAFGAWLVFGTKSVPYADLLTHKVGHENLQLTVTERGALESAENAEIVCRVKAGSQGSTVATTVRWLLDAGTEVQSGDKLIELDDSGLQDQLRTQKSTVDTARATWIQADEASKIQLRQNTSNIAKSHLNLKLATIAMQNYLE